MTTYGDQVSQFGGMPVSSGAGRLMQVFEGGNVHFVDGDNGKSGHSGKKPGRAYDLISTALANTKSVKRGATIYVRPRMTSASAQTYYQDSIDIPKTHPGLSIIGCGNTWGNPNAYAGVQIKPTTAGIGDHLIDVLGASLLLENMRLTLSGGTTDAGKSIVHGVSSTTATPGGLTIRGCFFENDKSHPGISGSDATAAIGIGTATYCMIENCTFQNLLGGIAMQSVNGSMGRIQIRNNVFAGAPGNRDCDIIVSINDASWCTGIVIHNNVFSDGKPAHAGGGTALYIDFPYLTAGTGILANNWFASVDKEAQYGEAGTDANIADQFFQVNNYCGYTTMNEPYGIIGNP